jgi:hypothetical protein
MFRRYSLHSSFVLKAWNLVVTQHLVPLGFSLTSFPLIIFHASIGFQLGHPNSRTPLKGHMEHEQIEAALPKGTCPRQQSGGFTNLPR